ncbi:MAG: metallophosphoesterase, partial [Sphingomicrobium sp.]
ARDAKLIDSANRWAGGRTTLVQLGDIADRGPDTLLIIRHLQQLQAEAPRAGGKVIVVTGNHEAMNVVGDLRYVTPQEYAEFADAQSPRRRDAWFDENRKSILADFRSKNPNLSEAETRAAWIAETPLGWVEHRRAWLPAGEIEQWVARNPAIARVGSFLFVHGGISAEQVKNSISIINRRVSEAIRRADDSPESILSDPLGPLWYRGLLIRDNDAEAARSQNPGYKYLSPAKEVDEVLRAYGARHIVVGHTPTLKGVTILHGGKLVRADTGISSYYKGPLGWLEIIGETMTPRLAKRSARQ